MWTFRRGSWRSKVGAPRTRRSTLAAVAVLAPVFLQTPAAGTAETVRIPGSELEFELVYLPGGAFAMGSPPDEPDRDEDEGPRHEVRLSPFWIGRHEVTWDEYDLYRFGGLDPTAGSGVDAVSRPSPPYEDPAHGLGKSGHPAVGITRRAALQYARWLSGRTGRLFRLPTEAEWEYACRAGTGQAFPFDGGVGELEDHAWSASNAALGYRPIGGRSPSRWGLFDMHGNVAEWVLDSYDAAAYGSRAAAGVVEDPVVGDPPGGRGVVRGGSFLDGSAEMRCAARLPEDARWKRRDPQIPKSRWWNTDSQHVGFRLVSPAREMTREQIRDYWRALFGEDG